jgi:hypothetical protein
MDAPHEEEGITVAPWQRQQRRLLTIEGHGCAPLAPLEGSGASGAGKAGSWAAMDSTGGQWGGTKDALSAS